MYTAIIPAVGARRKLRDQHRDNKTLVSSDFAEVEEASAHPVSASSREPRERVFSPPAGNSGPHRGKTGRNRP